MITFTQGNLLEADAEALVNTVNTVGVMGKGIALMFKEAFPANFLAYKAACARAEVQTGQMFVTRPADMYGPRWLINFPTKQHWRNPSRMDWIVDGLQDLRAVIEAEGIRSIAIPPLGAGNGGLDWVDVRPVIERALAGLSAVRITVFEPAAQYQNVAKRSGTGELTPARAILAETIRRYCEFGMQCTLIEAQKLAWFLSRIMERDQVTDALGLRFTAERYGPYAGRLRHILDDLDGSYIRCDKRIADAQALDTIWFEPRQAERIAAYLGTRPARPYRPVIDDVIGLIDGFECPLGMEVLSTVDWLMQHGTEAEPEPILQAITRWPAGEGAARRKIKLFTASWVELALTRLSQNGLAPAG